MDATTTIAAPEPSAETTTESESIVVGLFVTEEAWRQWEGWQFEESENEQS